ncbi:MAG: ABC transporter ATP-binding protein [Oscillospiraceae bacterium]|nr:ABC transporter ATP-binding protein [Oscillospiraceae bacterium]
MNDRMNDCLLTLDSLSAGYNGADVIHDISFRVSAGENLSIIGPNGCGKTTLLHAIAHILPFTGEMALGGKSTRKMKHREIAGKIAVLCQISGIYFSYSVFDTVMMGRYLHIRDKFLGVPSREDKAYVTHCLEVVDLLAEKDREITKLSGGQLQRVFLARTLAQEPEIILLDEPTNHLDLKYQIELVEYLKEWAAEGNRAVIGVLHDINLALRLSGRLLVMKDGRVQAHGKTDEIVTGGLLERAYEVDVARYMRESLKMWEGVRD